MANAGDSRCVCSRRGLALALSRDHKPTDEEELQRISRVRSPDHPQTYFFDRSILGMRGALLACGSTPVRSHTVPSCPANLAGSLSRLTL